MTQALLEAHGLEPIPGERERDLLLRGVDHVLLGRDEAPLVVALLERAGVDRPRAKAVVAEAGRGDGAETGPGPDWRHAALARGVLLPRPGHGAAEVLHRERLAAPGRVVLCAGPLPACGAFGTLALRADALEAAAALAGGGLALRAPRVATARLEGRLPPGVGGADLALSLLAWRREAAADTDVVEFGGDGVGTLAMAERVGAAWLAAQAGLPSLFPADDVTRAALAALGRDQDWRRLEAPPGGEPAWRVALASLEPMVAPVADPAAGRAVRASAGRVIERVLVGPGATLEDLACLAERLAGSRVAEGTECVVVAGSRTLLDRAVAAGVVAGLLAAGVRVAEGEAAAQAAGGGSGLCFGVPLAALAEARARWSVAGIETLAAAARGGELVVPAPAGERPGPVEVAVATDTDPWLPAAVDGGAVPAAPGRPRGPGAARRRWRGEVLLVLGDDVEDATLLAPGARLEELRGRLRALAGALLAGVEPGLAERARRLGGGWLAAGTAFLRGEARAAAAACVAEAGIWGILARSYAPGAARTLAHAGVIPFTVIGEAPRRGDELEVAGLPEALAPGRPVAARDLTRGAHLGLAHELSAREIAILRAGGLVAHAVRTGPRGEEE